MVIIFDIVTDKAVAAVDKFISGDVSGALRWESCPTA